MRLEEARLAVAICLTPLVLGGAVVDARAADMTKTLHVAFANAEAGFDPQAASDTTTSSAVIGAIFDPLYERRVVEAHRRLGRRASSIQIMSHDRLCRAGLAGNWPHASQAPGTDAGNGPGRPRIVGALRNGSTNDPSEMS